MSREWFFVKDILKYNETDKAFNRLLDLYKLSLFKYFNIVCEDILSFEDLLKFLTFIELSKADSMFVDFLINKALAFFKENCPFNLPDKPNLKHHIEYEHYILNEEYIPFDYPEDLRSCLISIVVDFPK